MSQDNRDCSLICFLVTSLSYGGAETVLIKMAISLRQRGWKVKLISMLRPEARLDQLASCGIQVESLNMRRGIPDPRAIFRLASFLKKWKPMVLHSHMVHANLLGRVARLFSSVPVVVSTAHNIDEGGRWREIAYRLTDSLADITTNVSQAAVDRYIEVGVAPRNRIRFIPNGLNSNEFSPDPQSRQKLRNELGIDNKFVWLAVGRLVEAKDYPNMFRAFANLKQTINSVLLIVGQGELEDDLKRQVIDLGLDNNVKFLGVRQDMPELMNAADAYVMSSAWEGLPMVLLEAAATSLPIVATDVGGNREVVRDGITGYIVKPDDTEALVSALHCVMSMSEADRNKMGEAGREYVVKNYSLENVIDMWENLYDEFLTPENRAG